MSRRGLEYRAAPNKRFSFLGRTSASVACTCTTAKLLRLQTCSRRHMTRRSLLAPALLCLLSACVAAPVVDFANIDSACAQQCSANHTSCMSGFKLFPLANESSCKTAMETCAKTCPTKSQAAASSQPKQAPASAAEKLRELDALFKSGLISNAEYEAKRQEVLKAM